MKLLSVLIFVFASTFAQAALIPLKDERVIEQAKLSMADHLEKEGLSIDDAEFVFAFKDGLNKSTIYFEVKEHQGDHVYYMVTCRKEKCLLNYR
ncbi:MULTISPECIES: hypothetical protein [Vibrio]|jgi:hypothetical protein|uniref:Uncharacterized protein n=1 Tax=Vibrio mediterranei TaxID=689 RepID=A0ABX5DBT0_9VIBR|nr:MULTISPECIES: hypothetical protein [Vibrio]MCF4175361.1 hypothetical protein [Vibrio sp. McD22-P3]MDA0110298.1 hypothetical protein [Vibrio sp. La 4.2.2]PCD85448.1 hypothetical protein COR52_26790 [Vibrio mediterranei]PRQ66473.1 hypothetical protein COR51_17550 [Vibrio mediterranei]PTC03088.1 hypothetical protein C9980_18915 [Vibrio mediterranei]